MTRSPVAAQRSALFTTDHLLCRRWIATDVEPLFEVYSDADAMQWVGDGKPITRAQCQEWLEVTEANYIQRGYGMFTLELRETGEVVGFAGLVHPDRQSEAEIKYALSRKHWGRGLASELIPSLLRYGAEVHGLHRILATVARGNSISRHVLQKSGLQWIAVRHEADGSLTDVLEWLSAG